MARKKQTDESPVDEAVTDEEVSALESYSDAEVADEPAAVEPEPVAVSKPEAPAFPLAEGDYFFTPVLSRRAHSKGEGVRKVQERLGLPVTGEYDGDTLVAVQSHQKDRGEAMTGVVDAATWQELFG